MSKKDAISEDSVREWIDCTRDVIDHAREKLRESDYGDPDDDSMVEALLKDAYRNVEGDSDTN